MYLWEYALGPEWRQSGCNIYTFSFSESLWILFWGEEGALSAQDVMERLSTHSQILSGKYMGACCYVE